MGACHIQYALLLSLLGFVPCSDSLNCQLGSMMHVGSGLTKAAVEWTEQSTMMTIREQSCQEILVLIDVGKKSVLLGSKGTSTEKHRNVRNITVFAPGPGIMAITFYHVCDSELCNSSNSSRVLLDSIPRVAPPVPGRSQCPVRLHFKGSANRKSNLVFCPRGTRCYSSELAFYGGGLSVVFSISGCLVYPQKRLLKNQSSIGTVSITETRFPSKSGDPFSHGLVPSMLLAWMLGLRSLLSPSFTAI
ncbi:CD177 antigen-like [Rattus rattus]|uniref:CD177 antigen-like n=1 Tax=Rattus rattus TaxID=10117 RepID=UPI0013F32B96|nr:CD177 antigen-like [Rattus rattus]